MLLSPHFSREEIEFSPAALALGIPNRLPEDQLAVWSAACFELLEPIRTLLNTPIKINSGYRSPALNTAIGGVPNSQHQGLWIPKNNTTQKPCAAFDLIIKSAPDNQRPNLFLWRTMLAAINDFRIDQLIWEFGVTVPKWVHVSYVPSPQTARGDVLKAMKVDGKTQYVRIS